MTRLLLLAALLLTGLPVAAGAAVDRWAGFAAAAGRDPDSGVRALYASRGFEPLWQGTAPALARRSSMLTLLAREERLAASGFDTDKLARMFDGSPARLSPEADLALTGAALGYLARRAGGDAVRPEAAARVLAGLGALDRADPMSAGLRELNVVQAVGGWRTVRLYPAPSALLPPLTPVRAEMELILPPAERPRPKPDVPALRRRLVQSLDLPPRNIAGEAMDEALAAAVRRFQQRHGLLADGVVGVRTVAVMNQGVQAQVRQVELNLARRRELARDGVARYVEVNIPAYDLRLVDHGRIAFRSRVVVGDQDTQTPVFDDRMRYVELNPSWYVPKSITQEILTKEGKEPGYMRKAGFVWRGGNGEDSAPARLVQQPGPENALGRVKFVFPNHHAVYIHDTPNRGAFTRTDRTLSHGCIRIEKPMDFAMVLLGRQGWSQARLDAALSTSTTRRVQLDEPLPVFLDYRTASADPDGRLELWPDIYEFDKAGIVRFPSKGLPPEARPPAPFDVILPPAPPPVIATPEPAAPLGPPLPSARDAGPAPLFPAGRIVAGDAVPAMRGAPSAAGL